MSAHRNYPAPLKLCFESGFDLRDDTTFCPRERNALKEFYEAAKGTEWSQNENWTDPYIGHCDWYGVGCNEGNNTIKLELKGNGLSGKLTHEISNLTSLEVLDLNNNDIKVTHVEAQTMHQIKPDANDDLTFCSTNLCFFIQPGHDSHIDRAALESHPIEIELQRLRRACRHKLLHFDASEDDPLAWQ